MSANDAAKAAMPIVPLVTSRPAYGWPLVALFAAVGSLMLLLGYFVLAPHVAGSVVTHYGALGNANGWMTPGQFVAIGMGVEITLGVMLSAFVWQASRSPVVRTYSGRFFAAGLVALAGALLLVSIPGVWILQLASAAGAADSPLGGAWTGVLLGAVFPVVVMIVTLSMAFRRRQSTGASRVAERDRTPGPTTGGYRFRCSACGEEFVLPKVSILTPHMPASGEDGAKALLRVQCPVCGEKGWNAYLGK